MSSAFRRPGPGATLAAAVLLVVVACGGGPEPVGPDGAELDLGPLTGSWVATVRGDGIWQGRWDLHAQGGAVVLVQPDGDLIVPGVIDGFGSGAIVFGPDLTCDSNREGILRGAYSYELSAEGLSLRSADVPDTCGDRLTILTADVWERAPTVVMPLRVDVPPDASCDPAPSPDPGASIDPSAPPRPAIALPLPWKLENASAGIVVVLQRVATGGRALVAQAEPGETVTVDPQRGGSWVVADLRGRCLAHVVAVSKVSVATGQPPRIEPR
jgi:hypothetical protein